MLSLLRARVQSLVGELRSYKLCGRKRERERERERRKEGKKERRKERKRKKENNYLNIPGEKFSGPKIR